MLRFSSLPFARMAGKVAGGGNALMGAGATRATSRQPVAAELPVFGGATPRSISRALVAVLNFLSGLMPKPPAPVAYCDATASVVAAVTATATVAAKPTPTAQVIPC
jgi:hypothetical protein